MRQRSPAADDDWLGFTPDFHVPEPLSDRENACGFLGNSTRIEPCIRFPE